MATVELEELLASAVRDSDAAVTISASHDEASYVCAVSQGFEEMCGWSFRSILGRDERIHEAQVDSSDPIAAAQTRLAQMHGVQAAVVQTQRKASGELYAVFQYHRGLSLGLDPFSGEEKWYLVTVSIDTTEDFERELEGEGFVDRAMLEEFAISIAEQVKTDITDAIHAFVLRNAVTQVDDDNHGVWASEIEELEDDSRPVSIATPEWVFCPPMSKFMMSGTFGLVE